MRSGIGKAESVVPWRRVTIASEGCTLCGACAFVCPTAALTLASEGDALLACEANCIGCRLCEQACPEHVLALSPTIPGNRTTRVLLQQPLASCQQCGRPIAPKSLISRLESMFAQTDSSESSALWLCENCKSEQIPHLIGQNRPAQEATSPSGKVHRDRIPLPMVGGEPSSGSVRTVSRRKFLETSTLTAVSAVLLGGCASTPAKKKHRYGMVIDLNRCVGCNACVVACKAENHTPPGVAYMVVLREKDEWNLRDRPIFFARPCYHCNQPSCVKVCPTGATYKREQDGIVVVDYDKCIGCRYCIAACPYGARSFDFGEHYQELAGGYNDIPSPEYREYRPRPRHKNLSPQGNVRKCTFCLHLQDESGRYDQRAGRWPACAKTCTGKAIHFGDLDDPNDPILQLLQQRRYLQLKKELGNEPNVFYLT